MPTTPPASRGVSKSCSRAVIGNTCTLCLFLAAATLQAQIPGTITVRNLPPYAYGTSAMDSRDNLYIAGAATTGAPTTAGAAQTQPGADGCNSSGAQIATRKTGTAPQPCNDAYLTKVDVNGNTVYATFLGGPMNDVASAVTIDSAGNLYVTGVTGGSFPTTANAALAASTTSTTFAAKLNKDGSSFLYVTYLPDTVASVSGIAVDSQGNAYISGATATNHAIVIAVNAAGSTFPFTKTLSGSGMESASSVVVDSSGNLLISGTTTSPDFPVTAGVVQPKLAGSADQFVTKLDPSGNIIFSTYLGGSGQELGATMQTDEAGNIYLAGLTSSIDFPTTAGSLQPAPAVPLWNNSYAGGFLSSLSQDGRELRYSTYIPTSDGSANLAGPSQIAVGTAGDVYLLDAALAGWPITASAPQPCYNGGQDVFLAHFGPQGQLEDSTFLGHVPSHVSLPSNNYLPGDASVMILTHDGTSGYPALMQVRFGEPGWTAPACLTPALLNAATLSSRGAVAAGEIVSLVGQGIGPAAGVADQPGPPSAVPRSLGGVQVLFDGVAAPLLYAQSNQVNAIVPVDLRGEPTTRVTLQFQNTTFGPFTQQLSDFDPAIFRWNPGTSSQAAAINQDGTVNGPANPAPAGSYVSLWGTGFGPLATPCSDGGPNVDAADYLASGYSMLIDEQPSIAVQYSGGAPLLLCGVMQLNLQIPPDTPSGTFAIYPTAVYQSGSSASNSSSSIGATVVVK